MNYFREKQFLKSRKMTSNVIQMVALKMIFIVLISSVLTKAKKSTECKDGYYGNDCEYNCSNTCRNNKCRTSEVGTFSCTDGCIDGYRGDTCKSKCPPFCIKCQRYKTAQCLQCRPLYYGVSCERNCKKSCPNFGCDTEGKCKKCETGLYGHECNLPCNKNCGCNVDDRHTCAAQCEQKTGKCSHGCKSSYHGNMCQFQCSVHCKDHLCDAGTGVCVRGCKDGYFGEKCEFDCNEQCKESLCDRGSGQCEKGCTDGYYGKDCTKKCSKYCSRSMCERDNGTCTNGCSDGYLGSECVLGKSIAITANTTHESVERMRPDTTYLQLIMNHVTVIIVILMTTIISVVCLCGYWSNKEKLNMAMAKIHKAVRYIAAPKESGSEFSIGCENYEDDVPNRDDLSMSRTNSYSHDIYSDDVVSEQNLLTREKDYVEIIVFERPQLVSSSRLTVTGPPIPD